MKNKEIEELLNELKEVINSKKLSSTYCITNKHWQLLLSYIEQLENNRDKAIEYVEHHKFNKFGDIDCNEAEDIIDILKGDSE